MKKVSQMNDEELLEWLINFVIVAKSTPDRYGVTGAQMAAFSVLRDDLQEKINTRIAADNAARIAITAQATSREAAAPVASEVYQLVQINSAVIDADKEAVQVPPRKKASRTAPVRPEEITANGYEDNRNVVKWTRSGNKTLTQYFVEGRTEAETKFNLLTATTELTFEHLDVKPGTKWTYRVKAVRAGQSSTYSNEVSVY